MTTPTTSPAPTASPQVFRIDRGECLLFFAFDVGYGLDLAAARRTLAAAMAPAGPRPGAPHGVPPVFRPEPLRFAAAAPSNTLGTWTTAPEIAVSLFDFGAVSLAYRVELRAEGWEDLQRLAVAIDEDRTLASDARQRIAGLVAQLGDAVIRPGPADLVEDYVVFRAHHWTGSGQRAPAGALVRDAAAPLACVLRASPLPLSEFEIKDAVSCALGYGTGDLTVIDWKAAIVFDPDPADILAVLEFANVELLEMRFLDDRLDGALDRAYQALARRRERALFAGGMRDERRRTAALQMEGALLFESVNNAFKLLGDQFLARVYREATRRFHLAEWDASVLRKLDTLEGVYQKLADDHSNRRMEVLEWIIIVLIAVSIAIPFVVGTGK